MENLLWMLGRLKPYIPLILLALAGSALQSAGAAGVTLLVKSIVDDVFVLRDQTRVVSTVVTLLGFALLMQVGFFISKYLVSVASEATLRVIREEVFKKLLSVPHTFFIKHPAGDLISRIMNDVDKLRVVLTDHIPVLLREPLVVLVLLGVLVYRDPVLTGVLVLLVPVMALMVKYFGSKKGKHLKRVQESISNLTQVTSEAFQGIENLKVFSAEPWLLKNFKEWNSRILKASVKMDLYVTANTALNYMLGYTAVAGVLLYGGYRIVEGHLSPGEFVSYLTALFMIQPHLINSQKALMSLRGTLPVISRLREMLSLEEESSGVKAFPGLRGAVELRNVRVSVNGKEILRGVNLTIPKGEKLGIVGRTGSGKSTLVRLIPRLLDYEGEVLIDGEDLRNFDLRSLRGRIGMSTQETFLINGTIRENLLIAKPDATETEIREALRLALCDFVDRLEKGIDTVVGERGYSLSGGERQRIALARVFLKNPEIVILDEATSALDTNTEKKVLRNIFEFFEGRTLIIVAHRLSNVMECDRIVVMREGRIVEEGSFYLLVERKGEFYRIFRGML
jgi:ATP-binding cassette subfamily C protein/subfamily B ATP-binding cassette protein MsbA